MVDLGQGCWCYIKEHEEKLCQPNAGASYRTPSPFNKPLSAGTSLNAATGSECLTAIAATAHPSYAPEKITIYLIVDVDILFIYFDVIHQRIQHGKSQIQILIVIPRFTCSTKYFFSWSIIIFIELVCKLSTYSVWQVSW